jgi:hypothetical protein
MFSEYVFRFGRMIGHSEARLFVGFTQCGSDGGYDFAGMTRSVRTGKRNRVYILFRHCKGKRSHN